MLTQITLFVVYFLWSIRTTQNVTGPPNLWSGGPVDQCSEKLVSTPDSMLKAHLQCPRQTTCSEAELSKVVNIQLA